MYICTLIMKPRFSVVFLGEQKGRPTKERSYRSLVIGNRLSVIRDRLVAVGFFEQPATNASENGDHGGDHDYDRRGDE